MQKQDFIDFIDELALVTRRLALQSLKNSKSAEKALELKLAEVPYEDDTKGYKVYADAMEELRIKRKDKKFKSDLGKHITKKLKSIIDDKRDAIKKEKKNPEAKTKIPDFTGVMTTRSTPISGSVLLFKAYYPQYDYTEQEFLRLIKNYKVLIDNLTESDSNEDATFSKIRTVIKKKDGQNSKRYNITFTDIFGVGKEKRGELEKQKSADIAKKPEIKFQESETFQIIERTRRETSVYSALVLLAICTGARKIELLRQDVSDFSLLTKNNADEKEKEILERAKDLDNITIIKCYGVAKETLSSKFDPKNRKQLIKPLLVISWEEFSAKLKQIREHVEAYMNKNNFAQKDKSEWNKLLTSSRPYNENLSKYVKDISDDYESLAAVQKKPGKAGGEAKFHFFRKLYVSLAKELAKDAFATTDSFFIKEVLGHRNIESGATYNIVKQVNAEYDKKGDSESVKKVKTDLTHAKAEIKEVDKELKKTREELQNLKIDTEKTKKEFNADPNNFGNADWTKQDEDDYIDKYLRTDNKFSRHNRMSTTDHLIRIHAGLRKLREFKENDDDVIDGIKNIYSENAFKRIGLGSRTWAFYQEYKKWLSKKHKGKKKYESDSDSERTETDVE